MTKRILICDDHYDFYEMLKIFMKQHFKNYDIEIELSTNGVDGFLNSSKSKYDLIMSDFKMPAMDGIELINKVRTSRLSQNKDTPIIMISAYKPDLYSLYGGEESITFMKKPINIKQFMNYVEEKLSIY